MTVFIESVGEEKKEYSLRQVDETFCFGNYILTEKNTSRSFVFKRGYFWPEKLKVGSTYVSSMLLL
jgi:hypothetical protein